MGPVVFAACDPIPVWFAGGRERAFGFKRLAGLDATARLGEIADDPVLDPARAAPATPAWS